MLMTKVIDGKEEKIFTPDYTEVQYLLSDNSKMRVAMCKQCKETLTDEQSEKIMTCVVKGWKKEVDKLPWTPEKKTAHMEKYSALEIVASAEDEPADILKEKMEIFRVKKELKNGSRK
jgi:hypothetical protein